MTGHPHTPDWFYALYQEREKLTADEFYAEYQRRQQERGYKLLCKTNPELADP